MTDKRRIDEDPPAGGPNYAHLVPLVEGLIEHGNELANPPSKGGVFGGDQGGPVAFLTKRIDWDWVQENFELPDLVRYDGKDDEIFDHKNWISIRGSVQPRR
ncbi:MAG: hypothetical protein QOE05_425 [Actinomycetota bacterium]|nr:hypothetical protein [Actinomycetota bacterium]